MDGRELGLMKRRYQLRDLSSETLLALLDRSLNWHALDRKGYIRLAVRDADKYRRWLDRNAYTEQPLFYVGFP